MNKVYDFLKENNMLLDSFDRDEIIKTFKDDMKTKKTLGMFKTYLSTKNAFMPSSTILAIDAGGTNLRFILFKDGRVESEVKMRMFGVGTPITSDAFFDAMAEEIAKYDKFGITDVGFCFSYPMEVLPDNDGRIMWLTKEVKIDGCEGKVLGEEINKRLKNKKHFYLLNDTVACQLGVNADIGMILGTGFNMSYTDDSLGMIIDPELGQYGQLPQGKFDDILNEELNSPRLCSEKHISGVYLGKLIELCSKEYFKKNIPAFELSDVSDFLNNKGKLYEFFNENERAEFKEIIDALCDRAADRVAIFVECISEGKKEVAIGIEGSTIYKLPGYYEKVTTAIKKINDISFTFIDARDTIGIGSAKACTARK